MKVGIVELLANLRHRPRNTWRESACGMLKWILGGQRRARLCLAPLTERGLRSGVFVNGFSEDELIVRINRCGSRSIVAKEGNAARTYSLATLTEPKFRRLQIRRQHPFEDYVLDFYCPSAKLAIELDGGGHNHRAGQIRDRTRSEFLARHGVIVLRFWNHQVRRELDSVLRAIWFALGERQQNKPSPPLEKGEAKSNRRSI
jgi:very-short-patch-repair endonuclease